VLLIEKRVTSRIVAFGTIAEIPVCTEQEGRKRTLGRESMKKAS
jgi:hypothetical protein